LITLSLFILASVLTARRDLGDATEPGPQIAS